MSDIPFFISLNFCPPLLQELVHDQQMRTQMKDRLKKSQQATTSNPVPLLPGDRVLCRQTQYKSTTGHGKFQEFTVVSMSGGLAKLQDAVGHTTLDLCKNRCSKCFRECSRQQMSQSVCLHLQQKTTCCNADAGPVLPTASSATRSVLVQILRHGASTCGRRGASYDH